MKKRLMAKKICFFSNSCSALSKVKHAVQAFLHETLLHLHHICSSPPQDLKQVLQHGRRLCLYNINRIYGLRGAKDLFQLSHL